MSVRILFSAADALWSDYESPISNALKRRGIAAEMTRQASPDEVDYIVFAPGGPVRDFRPYTRAKAVLGLWAGVEGFVSNPTLTQPLTRMVDPGLEQGMAEWVCGHILRYHLGLDADIINPDNNWASRVPPLAGQQTVGILGMGRLGSAVAAAASGLGFQVLGWARRQKDDCAWPVHFGAAGLERVLGQSDYVVLLLPHTADTANLMNDDRFVAMKPGAVLLNPGRGALIDDAALLDALDKGQVTKATLDVFDEEPLPPTHPFWEHPDITVTPHIASATRPDTASEVIAENIRRGEAGEPFLHLVDRDAGY